MEEIVAKDAARAKFVKREREARAWPQQQLADVAEVNLRTIQRLEKDGAASFETLRRVASAFDMDVRDLNPTSSSKRTNKPQQEVHFLNRLTSGKSLADVVLGADQLQIEHDEAQDPRAVGAMKDILQLLKQDVVRLHDADPVGRLQVEAELTQELKGLETYGFYIFGTKRVIPRITGTQKTEIAMCTLYMSHARSPKIIRDKRANMVIPALLPEVAK